MISVYLSNQTVLILDGAASGGRAALRAAYALNDTENCIINGIVTDAAAFSRTVGAFWEEKKLPRRNVRLVLNSSQLVSRLLTMPPLGRSAAERFLAQDFGDVERAAEPVFSTLRLDRNRKTGMSRELAFQADRGYIRSFLDLFAGFGVTVSEIVPALDCAVRLLRNCSGCREGTCLVELMDESYMTVLLFVDGAYVYSGRKRMFNEPGTPEYCAEAVQSVSNMEQFQRANYKDKPLGRLYLCGVGAADFARCRGELASSMPELSVQEFPISEFVTGIPQRFPASGGSLLFASGAYLRAEEKITFFGQAAKKERRVPELARKAAPVLVLLAILLVTVVVLGVRITRSKAQLARLNGQIETLNTQVSDDAFSTLNEQAANEKLLEDGLQTAWDDLKTYPLINNRVDSVLQRCAQGYATMEITGFDSATGILSFNATVNDMEKAHQFIALLKKEDLFTDVDYTGYSYQEREDNWRVNVVCTLREAAGREDAS